MFQEGTGRITEAHFKRIMKNKMGEEGGELTEMMDAYRNPTN